MTESDSSDYSSDEETLQARKIRLQHFLPDKGETGQVSLFSLSLLNTEMRSGLLV